MSSLHIDYHLYDTDCDNMTFCAEGEVRFGTDKDVESEDCSLLFEKYMPLHLRHRKVTQRMFVQ